MSVFMCAKVIHTVIKVNCVKVFKTNDFIKLRDNPVKVVYNIVATIPDMAGIKTHTNPAC